MASVAFIALYQSIHNPRRHQHGGGAAARMGTATDAVQAADPAMAVGRPQNGVAPAVAVLAVDRADGQVIGSAQTGRRPDALDTDVSGEVRETGALQALQLPLARPLRLFLSPVITCRAV